jgi:hypothetical protein
MCLQEEEIQEDINRVTKNGRTLHGNEKEQGKVTEEQGNGQTEREMEGKGRKK